MEYGFSGGKLILKLVLVVNIVLIIVEDVLDLECNDIIIKVMFIINVNFDIGFLLLKLCFICDDEVNLNDSWNNINVNGNVNCLFVLLIMCCCLNVIIIYNIRFNN